MSSYEPIECSICGRYCGDEDEVLATLPGTEGRESWWLCGSCKGDGNTWIDDADGETYLTNQGIEAILAEIKSKLVWMKESQEILEKALEDPSRIFVPAEGA